MANEPNQKFVTGLKELGYSVEILSETRVAIPYIPFEGKLKGQQLKVGLEIPPDFEISVPTGPHITPPLLTINKNANTHPEKVLPSPFGTEWQYLSRPYPEKGGGWKNTKRTVGVYMHYVEEILNTL